MPFAPLKLIFKTHTNVENNTKQSNFATSEAKLLMYLFYHIIQDYSYFMH